MSRVMEFLSKMSYIKKRGEGLTQGFETGTEDDIFEEYFGDDSQTHYKIGDRVQKATEEWGDVHPKGTQYIITGAMHDNGRDIYMVQEPGSKEMCMTVPYKIEPVK